MGSNKPQQSPEKGEINWNELIKFIDACIKKAKDMGVDEESIQKLEEQKKLILAIKEGRLNIAEAVEMVKLIHSINKFSDPV